MKIASQQFAVIAETMAQCGLDAERVLEQAGLPPLGAMDQTGWRRLEDLDAVMRMAQAASGDPGFGLVVASSPAQVRQGTIAMLVMHAPTLRAALDDIGAFVGLVQTRPELSYAVRGSECVLSFDPLGLSRDGLRFRSEQVMGGMMLLLRYCGLKDSDPLQVQFNHPEPAYAARYRGLLGPSVRFGQPASRIAFPVALLDAPQACRDATSYALVRARAQAELRAIAEQDSIAGAVRRQLEQAGLELPTMAQTARALGISVRTLRRRLIAEGCTYARLLEDHRREGAERLLQEGSLPLKLIAAQLGYRSASSFHRAFKQHTRMTPLQWQLRHLQAAAGGAEAAAPTRQDPPRTAPRAGPAR